LNCHQRRGKLRFDVAAVVAGKVVVTTAAF